MITCEPDAYAAVVHDRMPVILPRGVDDVCFDMATPFEDALALLVPYREGEMRVERWSFERDAED